MRLTSPTRMSQSSASYRIIAIRRAWNLIATAMQAIVKQITFAAMILGPMSSDMCISCSFISAGVGREAMLSDNLKRSLAMQKVILSRELEGREGECSVLTFGTLLPTFEPWRFSRTFKVAVRRV